MNYLTSSGCKPSGVNWYEKCYVNWYVTVMKRLMVPGSWCLINEGFRHCNLKEWSFGTGMLRFLHLIVVKTNPVLECRCYLYFIFLAWRKEKEKTTKRFLHLLVWRTPNYWSWVGYDWSLKLLVNRSLHFWPMWTSESSRTIIQGQSLSSFCKEKHRDLSHATHCNIQDYLEVKNIVTTHNFSTVN